LVARTVNAAGTGQTIESIITRGAVVTPRSGEPGGTGGAIRGAVIVRAGANVICEGGDTGSAVLANGAIPTIFLLGHLADVTRREDKKLEKAPGVRPAVTIVKRVVKDAILVVKIINFQGGGSISVHVNGKGAGQIRQAVLVKIQ
jgi:hypothetical protein